VIYLSNPKKEVVKMTVGSKLKQTLASLRGAESVLRTYANQSQKEETQKVYQEAVQVSESIICNLEERLKQLEFQEPQYKGF
jgi:hydrogenase maturation factor HypF (carbamoyltransferase family)